jgi:hypothetical protein
MTAFSRTALKTVTSGGIIATALIAFTGIPAQATVLPSCDGVTTIPATEAALRAALAGVEPVICIEPGTIDLSSAGVDSTPGPIEITRSVAIIGVDGVTLDGGIESELFTMPNGVDAIDVTVQNLTFQNGYTVYHGEATAIWFDRPGTLTILDSTFTGNGGYGTTVFAYDSVGSVQPFVTVNNSTFTNNGDSSNSDYGGAITGYGDVTITNSSFVSNAGSSLGAVASRGAMTVQGNLFEDNFAGNAGGAISAMVGTGAVDISNNTFRANNSANYGGAVNLERDATFANNTFVDNETNISGDAIYKDAASGATLFANIFAASNIGPTVGELGGTDIPYVDLGANISTFDGDAAILTTSALVPGQVGATFPSIGIGPLSNYGGPTQTMALEPPSIAIGAVTPAIYNAAASIARPGVDQRDVTRGDGTTASDSGAYEYSAHPVVPVDPAELAKTGANTGSDSNTSIALAGGALLGGAALIGAATLVTRRRQSV